MENFIRVQGVLQYKRKTLVEALVAARHPDTEYSGIQLLTGVNHWKSPDETIDEWERGLEMRELRDPLIKGGRHITPEQAYLRRANHREVIAL